MATTARTLEFMVEMRCERCVESVREAIEGVDGTIAVEVSLRANTATATTTANARAVTDAVEARGHKIRLIGQGSAMSREVEE